MMHNEFPWINTFSKFYYSWQRFQSVLFDTWFFDNHIIEIWKWIEKIYSNSIRLWSQLNNEGCKRQGKFSICIQFFQHQPTCTLWGTRDYYTLHVPSSHVTLLCNPEKFSFWQVENNLQTSRAASRKRVALLPIKSGYVLFWRLCLKKSPPFLWLRLLCIPLHLTHTPCVASPFLTGFFFSLPRQ